MPAVPEVREAVQIDALALPALEQLQQATLAHRHVVSPDGNGGRGAEVPVVEALLVVVQGQLVHGDAFGQQVVCDEDVEQIVLVAVVFVVHGIGVVALSFHPCHDVFLRYVLTVLTKFFLPELVGLCKEGEAVLAMLWRFDFPATQLPLEVGEGIVLVECLVAFVPYLGECVDQSACLYELGHDAEIGREVVGELVQRAAQRLVAGIDDIRYFVDEAVDGLNVAIGLRDGADAVDATVVEVFLVVCDAYLAVGHRGDFELLVRLGELGRDVGLLELCAVEDAVQHHHGADAVQCLLVGEGIPVGFGDDALDDKRVEIELDGFVGRSEAGVVAVSRHELIDGRFAHRAYFLLLQQPEVLAELWMILEIAGNGAFLKDVAGRGID